MYYFICFILHNLNKKIRRKNCCNFNTKSCLYKNCFLNNKYSKCNVKGHKANAYTKLK